MICHFRWERRKRGPKHLFLPEITRVVSVESRSSDSKSLTLTDLDLGWHLEIGNWIPGSAVSPACWWFEVSHPSLGSLSHLLPQFWMDHFSFPSLFQRWECIARAACSVWLHSLPSLLSSPCLISCLCHFSCVMSVLGHRPYFSEMILLFPLLVYGLFASLDVSSAES